MTKKEKLMMVKQLGMTHLLYHIKRKVIDMFSTPSGQKLLKNIYEDKPLEDIILHWMNDENKIIDYLDAAEKGWKEKCTTQENINQTDP
jgi:hypothetical protein